MAIELSRMDFHVTRFMESEDVETMSASEVGQYCLLLFKAWMLAKDASLPVEPEKLAKYARVKNLSPEVLSKFPIVLTEFGQRRRNEVQFGVWLAAKKRSGIAREKANIRWNGTAEVDATALPEHPISNAIPDHTKTSIPEQAEQIGTEEDMNIKNALIDKSRAILGVRIAPTDINWTEVKALVRAYGEDAVSDKFEEWAKSQTSPPNYPLSGFVRVADALLSGKFASSVSPEDLSGLANDIAALSDGQVVFNMKQKIALGALLANNSPADIKSAFQEFWGNISGDDFLVRQAAKTF